MDPVQYSHERFSVISLSIEIVLVACFCVLFVVAKEILVLNKFKEAWLSVLVLPLYFFTSVDQCKIVKLSCWFMCANKSFCCVL
mgnify:CR=1 FL=1|jgi:hypothetical protein